MGGAWRGCPSWHTAAAAAAKSADVLGDKIAKFAPGGLLMFILPHVA